MNQPQIRYRKEKCVLCGAEILMPQYYDKRLSDWKDGKVPMCDDCKWGEGQTDEELPFCEVK